MHPVSPMKARNTSRAGNTPIVTLNFRGPNKQERACPCGDHLGVRS